MAWYDLGSDIDWGQILGGTPETMVPQPTFQDRFNSATGQMPSMLPQPQANQSPISPEALASSAAARGVPPPPVDITPPLRMPSPGAVDQWRTGVDSDMGGRPGEVGAALTGKTVGAPMDITSQAQKDTVAAGGAPTDMSAQSKDKQKLDKFAEALKGVKAPPAPVLQKLGTPAAPRATTAIKGGDIIALLQAINAGQSGSSYNLPSTLGAALRK